MLVCQRYSDLQPDISFQQDFDWSASAQAYKNLEEMPSFIVRQRHSAGQHTFTTTSADPQCLQGKHLQLYSIVLEHVNSMDPPPLRLIISGTAGTGKSYLIHCLRLLLGDKVQVATPTGVAAFNIEGHTLHTLLDLPTRGDFKDLEGERLHRKQEMLSSVSYLFIDEMSMVGRKIFGQIDIRLRQIFPHKADQLFGGCSCLLFGDFGQLPPVMDLPLYTTVSRSSLSDIGSTAYQLFNCAVVLDQPMHQSGQDPDQVLFRDILLRLRNGLTTETDWRHLMQRIPSKVQNHAPFQFALQLHPTTDAVVQHNLSKLHTNGQPVATIKAVHTGANASKASPDDAGGLYPIICMAQGARVMLTSNLWVDVGLVNGAMGTVTAICYQTGHAPPALPVSIMI